MELRILHFYPDLMSLYGSYANVSVLKRRLEALGHSVTVERVAPGDDADPSNADFLFMGAGTERAQKAALADFARFSQPVKDAAAAGVAMLFAGTAMELLGASITAADGTVYPGIGLADFTARQGKQRFVEDVLGETDLYPDPVVGFLNTCTVLESVKTPLLRSLSLGCENSGKLTPEGFHQNNVFASALTGPLLVKNPRMLDAVVNAIYAHRGLPLPASAVLDHWAEDGYAITAEQLRLRCQHTDS